MQYYNGLPETKLQMVQNSAARLITGTKRRYHITPVLSRLHWLLVHQLIVFKLVVLVYRAVHRLSPIYFSSTRRPDHFDKPNKVYVDITCNAMAVVRSRVKIYCSREKGKCVN